jgi:cold shock protein
MSVKAKVRQWSDEEGWGVLDSPETPGGCWVSFTALEMTGYRSLRNTEWVELDWQVSRADSFSFTATRVRPLTHSLDLPISADAIDGAYRSELHVEYDDPGASQLP